MNEQMYGYTFPLDTGGIYFEVPFKIHVGQKFDYWGYTWIVGLFDEDENATQFICERI
jgi:hypothetical protein